MRTYEIGTVVVAGVLSLASLFLIDQREKLPAEAAASDTPPANVLFTDNSAIMETSVPAPTAEPPATGDEVLFESVGGSAPVPVPVDGEGKPMPPVEEDAPELSGVDDVPVVPADASTVPADVSTSPVGPQPGVKTEGPSLAGVEFDTGEEVEDENVSTFEEAIAAATGSAPVPMVKTSPTAADATTGEPGEEGTEPASIIEETPTGFWLKEAKLNDVFQHLSQLGNYQYFHNADLEGPQYIVTGQLMDDDPIKQMEELSLMYGVTIHKKGNTVYALTAPQLSQLPTEPFRYQLKYLRPSDIEQIKLILQPFLTPGSGIIEYESKTNTLIVMDNARKLDALALFLDQIDQPKQQIAIETRILRVTSSSRNRIGVDWSSVLGDGLEFGAATSLNALFNLPDLDQVDQVLTAAGNLSGNVRGGNFQVVNNTREYSFETTRNKSENKANLVLSPLQLNAVLRALNAGGLAQQESSPTLIAEDNEEGLISIIDRIPIITSTISETDAGQNITEEVRYAIDESDPVGDPSTTREVGVSVAVTPTILPDDTIRMSLRPRSAQVVEYVQSPSGNLYPRVNESTVTTTARVPNGHSLLIGGFYEEVQTDDTNKVPILGDLPAVNLLFKSTDKIKEHTSLVFIVTPKLYRPNDTFENDLMSHEIHDAHVLPTNHDYPDRDHPGTNYRSNMRDTLNNAFEKYEPDAPSNLLLPDHPYNLPQAKPVHGKVGGPEPQFNSPSVKVRSANGERRKGGFLGKVFGGNKSNRVQ